MSETINEKSICDKCKVTHVRKDCSLFSPKVESVREKLIKDLQGIDCDNNEEDVADYILADRARILAPLMEYKSKFQDNFDDWGQSRHTKAIDATLRAAGLIKGE